MSANPAIKEVTPYVIIAHQTVDVRDVIANFQPHEIFGPKEGHGNPLTNKLTMLSGEVDVTAQELDELLNVMSHFSYIRWNPAYPQSPQQSRPGFIFISPHSPEELVEVKRPDQPNNASEVVPENILGTELADSEWEIIARFILNEKA